MSKLIAITIWLLALPGVAFSQDDQGSTWNNSGGGGDLKVGEIPPEEVDKLVTRRKSRKFWSFGVGPFGSKNLGSDSMMYHGTTGYHWEVHTQGEIRTTWDLAFSSDWDALFSTGTIGGVYFLTNSEVSPLAGGEFGFGFADGPSTSSRFSFAGGLFIGVRIFRTADLQLEIDLKYSSIFGENDLGLPAAYGGRIVLLF